MLRIRQPYRDNNVPPGGWIDEEPSLGLVTRGASFADLVQNAAVALRRAGVQVPPDLSSQIEARVAERLGKVAPGWVYDPEFPDDGDEAAVTEATAYNKSRKVKEAALRYGTVTPVEANLRAQICGACPRKIAVLTCRTCSGTHAALERLMGKLSTPHDYSIQACGVDKVFNRTHIWFPKDFFLAMIPSGSRFKTERYPETCWKRKLLENDNG